MGQFPSSPLLQKIQKDLNDPGVNDHQLDTNVPCGEILKGTISDSAIYPGTENHFQVYVPAQYDPSKPACLLVKLDGLDETAGIILDNLIASKEVPILIGVGITADAIFKDPPGTPERRALRFNRSYEFDSLNDHFPDCVLKELLPVVQKLKTQDGRAIVISSDGNDLPAAMPFLGRRGDDAKGSPQPEDSGCLTRFQ